MEFRRSIDTIGAGQECQTATKIGRFLRIERERPATIYSASRLVTLTRKIGLDFSDGSISNVCEVFTGS